MAQYFQVLSQGGDKSTAESLRQLYPNLIENQTVQYVINQGDQQFQGQQIVVSSDQLMVIENQPQHVIVDQSSITYQNPQYILQENVIDYQDSQPTQQIFYMEEVDTEQPILNKADINNSQEIVASIRQPQLNQLRQQICVPQTSVPHIQHSRGPTHIQHNQSQLLQQRVQIQHPRQAMQQVNQRNEQLQHSAAVHQKVTANQETVRGNSMATKNNVPPLHFTQPAVKQSEITESDNHEAVALADGRIVSLSAYKQMLADSKSFNAQKMAATREKYQTDNVPKSKFKSSPVNRSRGKKVNTASGEYLQQPNINSSQQQFLTHQQQMKANRQNQPKIPQNQFMQQHSQHMQNQQAKSESLQYVQPNYIIQSPSQHQSVGRCPLPSYISASQIKEIIDNTPATEEYSDSIRMLVLLEDGEQRLITFTLPKENCTIQEILEQVGVNYHPDTKISCTEVNHSGVNYLVTVGHVDPNVVLQLQGREPEEEPPQASNHKVEVDNSPDKEGTADSSSVEMTEPPVYKSGYLAVCNHCGITSEDFNRCARCHHKLPEEVKQIPMGEVYGNDKSNDMLNAHQTLHDKKGSLIPKNMNLLNKVNGGSPLIRKRKQKAVDPDPVILTLSSEDEEESPEELSEAQKILKSLSSAVSLKAIRKEPTVNDLQEIPVTSDIDSSMDFEGVGKDIGQHFATSLLCRTIRIGSYRYTPKENLVIESKGILFKVPMTTDPNTIKTILLERKHMIKVLVNFQKSLPVIFYYVVPSFALYVREQLGMVKGGDFYFDPLSNEEPYKRITVLVENVNDDIKVIFKHIYTKPNNIMDELTTTEANDILIKTCPKELSKVVASAGYTEIRKILIYPPGQGGIPINTEDYVCLGQDQFLNDVIIDFYLKYLVLNLPPDVQKKVHVFSTFFYKRLTTKPMKPTKRSHPTEVDSNLTQAQKRHARVKKWTKNVNLFEKDFVVVPINENCHWFLAIICFPGMDGCYTMNGKPYAVKKSKKITKKDISSRLGSEITFTPIKKEKEEKAIPCEDDDASDKDEAEGDESELDSGEDSEEPENPESSATEVATAESTKKSARPAIKRPCILIFDSLTGASRVRVVSTLRGYLTCEYKVKMGVEKSFDRDTIIGNCPKIPQQTNFTDCGLYLLQYVEQFFKDPIKDYYIPIKHLENWFDEFVVTKKREDISLLIKDLMLTQNRDPNLLPDIAFPTLNGKFVERLPEDEDEEFMDEFEEEEDEEDYTLDSSDVPNDSITSEPQLESDLETNLKTALPINRSRNQIKINLNQNSSLSSESQSSKDNSSKSLVESPIKNVLKTNTSEVVPQSSRDTLSYLKSKRIIKHNKSADQVDVKRIKLSTE